MPPTSTEHPLRKQGCNETIIVSRTVTKLCKISLGVHFLASLLLLFLAMLLLASGSGCLLLFVVHGLRSGRSHGGGKKGEEIHIHEHDCMDSTGSK